MKIFNQCEGFKEKVNFVDDSNVVLGYDLSQSCCEHAGWFISDKPENHILEIEYKEGIIEDFEDYYFDTTYLFKGFGTGVGENLAIFRITNGKKDYYIHLFNCHEGYYAHGFEFNMGERNIVEDYI